MQVYFSHTSRTAPDADGQSSRDARNPQEVGGARPRPSTAASIPSRNGNDVHAVHRLSGPTVDQRDIKKLTTEPGPKLNPANDPEKTGVKNDVVTPSLLDMSTELKRWVTNLPEHWHDQSFRNDALTRFMRHSTNTDDDKCEIDSATCLASADKLLSMGAVPDDDTQKAINMLVDYYLLRELYNKATEYEYIWAAAKCPQKSMKVDCLLHKFNRELSEDCTYTYDELCGIYATLVKPLARMLRIPGITITPEQQRFLDMAYIKVLHNDDKSSGSVPDKLTWTLQELGGRDGGEMLCKTITLAVERKTEELQTSLKLLKQGFDDLNDRLDKLEDRACSCTVCTIL